MFGFNALGSKKHFGLVLALAAIGCSVAVMTGQQTATGPYTAAQAAAGRTLYEANCASCHAADLSGIASASALTGGLFMGSWGGRTVGDLVGFMAGAMPPTNPGGLGDAAYV